MFHIMYNVNCAGCNVRELLIYYYESALTPRPVETLKSPEHGAQFFLHPNTNKVINLT